MTNNAPSIPWQIPFVIGIGLDKRIIGNVHVAYQDGKALRVVDGFGKGERP
jgi:hypothetical protein